tara:strand:- start:6779 stop:8191 length:1413 start_codon:yes stop_codon:yes gene_type:complete
VSKIKPKWEHGAVAEDSPNKVFCTAPWTHTYISPQSERRMCCASREEHQFQKQYIDASNDEKYGEVKESGTIEDYKPVSLKEHWNSPYMMDIRKRLMAGEKIPQCDVCNDSLLSNSTYRQWFTGFLFNDKIDQCFEETDENGYTTMEPISFDYRYSNLCNFKCRMCGEQLSSTWETEKRKHNLWSPEQQPFMVPENKKIIEKFQKEVVEEEFWEYIKSGTVEELYWVGGEPLMYDIHWKSMDRLQSDNNLHKVHLRYNSNLSRVRYKDYYLYDWLPQAKDWTMCASIDGTGPIGEFVRTGLKWDEWDRNFREGVALPGGKDKMIMDLTITGPGLFDIKNFLDYALELDVKIETKRMFAFHADIVLSPMAWPRHILDEIVHDLLNYCRPRVTEKQQTLIRELEQMLISPTFQEEWPEEAEDQFFNGRKYQQIIQAIRKDGQDGRLTINDIYCEHPALWSWWNRPDPKHNQR